jgi:integrase/recombinase XerC
MPAFAERTKAPPRMLSADEQTRLLKVSGEHRDGFRDHCIFSIALGTALRLSEILALDLFDVLTKEGKVRRTIQLQHFKGQRREKDPSSQRVILPDATFYKLEKWIAVRRKTRIAQEKKWLIVGPLFFSNEGRRLHPRSMRDAFYTWQERAGFDHRYNFHALRHTAISNIYRSSGDIRIAQRVARHRNLQSTTIYEHASDDMIAAAVKKAKA